MKQLVERALRRLWGPRWNAIARAEFLRNFTGVSFWSLAVGSALLNGVVIGAWFVGGPEWAGKAARWLTVVASFLSTEMPGKPMGQMLELDDRLGTTDGWLLTSAPRNEILWARLAGHSAQGPLFILCLFPTYCLAAASLHGAGLGLFVCGHLTRAGSCFVALDFTIASVAAAVPVAILAMAADSVATVMMGSNALAAAVHRAHRVAVQLRFLTGVGEWWHQRLKSSLIHAGILAQLLLVEGGAAAVSGLAAYWMTQNAHLPAWAGTVIGLALGAVLAALLVDRRLALAGSNIGFAAERYDEALIRDEPE